MTLRARFQPVSVVAVLSLVACVGSPDPTTGCYIESANAEWQNAVIQASVTQPNMCPFLIPSGTTMNQQFAGTIRGEPGWITTSFEGLPVVEWSIAYTRVFNNALEVVSAGGAAIQNNFAFGTATLPRAEISVDYTAGTSPYGFPPGVPRHDLGHVKIHQDSYFPTQIAEGAARLTYTTNPQVSIAAPSSGWPYTPVNLSVTVNNAANPISYSWYINGQYAGWTTPNVSFSGAVGTWTLRADASDADGDVGSATHILYILDPGCAPPKDGIEPDSTAGDPAYIPTC